MQTNCVAIAKIVENKKLKTLRLLVTFDKTKRDKDGNIIVSLHNAAFVSGDICNIADETERKMLAINKVLKQAEAQLRTNNFMFI